MYRMRELLESMPANWHLRPPLRFGPAEGLFQKLPGDCLEFFKYANGGEGKIGKVYLTIWQLDNLDDLNIGYGFHNHMHDKLIVVGTTDDAFVAFDFSEQKSHWVVFPFGDFCLGEVCTVSDSFSALLFAFLNNEFPDRAKKMLTP
ncbi:hypothetical protein RMR16_024695 (plasmid) [Agrobacterium sp. rho-13.3]|uniref:hypothetical protein n=1 Tax=Agrobacterium sp. rho-13.3 TaxID=3072980 RepID=UPI002A0FFD20|nr:hypothetical protein [Agrobacterium sp. rho-13.3]MDX8310151.1 hypothetical protein [Agrobacterium sp. rho-13.3]